MHRGDEAVVDLKGKARGTAGPENGDVTSVNERVPKAEQKLKKETEKKDRDRTPSVALTTSNSQRSAAFAS